MRGLLADVNVQGHSLYLRRLLQSLDLWDLLIELGLIFATFRDFRLPGDLDDRTLWSFCQREGWVLFTANRNDEGPNSLHATLMESWIEGLLPVLTLANKVSLSETGRTPSGWRQTSRNSCSASHNSSTGTNLGSMFRADERS